VTQELSQLKFPTKVPWGRGGAEPLESQHSAGKAALDPTEASKTGFQGW
jgi:hypothetical protein